MNPYEPPVDVSKPASQWWSQWYLTYLAPAFKPAFWLGIVLFIFGSFMTFYPGAEVDWFAFTAALVGLGMFVPGRYYRIAAIPIVAVCLFAVYSGYHRGLEYQERLKWRELENQKFLEHHQSDGVKFSLNKH